MGLGLGLGLGVVRKSAVIVQGQGDFAPDDFNSSDFSTE